ncbi:hypothetical protein Tco_1128820 [Tanacetum coccineum]
MELRMEGYGTDRVTIIPTQIFSVNNLILKKGQHEGPSFTAHIRRRKHISSSKQNLVSKLEATKSKPPSKEAAEIPTCHFKRKKESSSAMDSNLSEPSASTPVVAELYKEAHQATGDPKSLGVTSEKRAHLQLSSDLIKAGARKDQLNFMDLDSIEDDLIIVVDEISKHKLEKEKRQVEAEVALLSSKPSFPNVAQLNELLWELLVEFLSVPTQVETVQAKLKTVDALPSLLNKVTQALNQFAQAIASTSKKTGDASVP